MAARLLLALAVFAAGAACSARPRMVRDSSVWTLSRGAAADLACAEDALQIRRLTLLTRVATGCNQQAVYAYDWLRDQWVFDHGEGRGTDHPPGPGAAENSSADEMRGPMR